MTGGLAEAIDFYTGHGVAVYPVDPRRNAPMVRAWNTTGAARSLESALALFEGKDDAGIGLACRSDNLTIIDIDPRNGGDRTFRKLVDRVGLETFDGCPQVATPRNGSHIYFRGSVAGVDRVKSALGKGIDVLTQGVTAPPTVRPKGVYAWRTPSGGFPDWDIPELPDALAEIIREQVAGRRQACAQGMLPQNILKGTRHTVLTRLGGFLRKCGAGPDEIRACLEATNIVRCSPPLTNQEVDVLAQSLSSYTPTVDPMVWLVAWSPKFKTSEHRVAIALASIAEFIVGPPTPAKAVMMLKTGLQSGQLYEAYEKMEELKSLRVIHRGDLAPVFEFLMPEQAEITPLYMGYESVPRLSVVPELVAA